MVQTFRDEDVLERVVEYITLVHQRKLRSRKAAKVSVGSLHLSKESPLWKCGGDKVVLSFISRHPDRLVLAATCPKNVLEVLAVSRGDLLAYLNSFQRCMYATSAGVCTDRAKCMQAIYVTHTQHTYMLHTCMLCAAVYS